MHTCLTGTIVLGDEMFRNGIQRMESFHHPLGSGELELAYCGYEQCVPGFVCYPHIRDCYLIHYVLSGEGFYEQDGVVYPVGPGSVFVIFPGHLVTYYAPDVAKPWSFCWIGFVGNRSDELLRSAGISTDHPVCPVQYPEDMVSMIQSCTDALQSEGGASGTLLQSCLYRILYILESSYCKSKVPSFRVDRTAMLVKDAVAFIEYNYMRDISVQNIAAYLKIDRTYLWKVFTVQTGLSPQQYLMQYRIEKACVLLRSSTLTITEVALSVGVSDYYYFSRLFKKCKGVPPSKYIRPASS